MTVTASDLPPETMPAARDAELVRLEEAALSATAVHEQMRYDGRLVRWAASSAKRARNINVLVGLSTRPLDERLAYGSDWYARHGRPPVVRLTSLGPDFALDDPLRAPGLVAYDETRVMSVALGDPVRRRVTALRFQRTDAIGFGRIVGQMRGATPEPIQAHVQRLQMLAVDILPIVVRDAAGAVVAAGLEAFDGDLAGLFDIVVDPACRRQGHAAALVDHMLYIGAVRGAAHAYVQVEPQNIAARARYARCGFADRYSYWYRSRNP